MPIVTLTSDFGIDDYYVGSLKGTIKIYNPEAEIIDISNSIPPFSLPAASYVFRSAYKSFPEQTIHIIAVDLYSASDNRILMVKEDNRYFIGPDNGIFSLIFEETPKHMYLLETPMFFNLQSFAQVVSNAIKQLNARKPENSFSQEIHNIRQMTSLHPQINQQLIRGTVIYVDGFENAVANISRKVFEHHANGQGYEIMFGRNRIDQLSKSYADVSQGEIACFFNSAELLEISINQGKAASLLGLKVGDAILIEIG